MTILRSLTLDAAAVTLAAVLCALPASAANDKSLQNMKGVVSWQHAQGTSTPLALNATTVLNDSDYTITGAASLAAIGLPDSSRVLVGSDSKVQLASFNQVAGTNAKFVVVGRVRFIVRHPQGAKADFTFQTVTGTVAVRGTEGDIEQNGTNLTVNVYEVCDPSQPVTVTTSNGQSFQLVAGQSLAAQLVDGIVRAKVEQLTQGLIDQFSPDFGVPASWDAAKGEIVSAAQSQASSAINNASGGYGSAVTSAVGSMFSRKKSTPSPSPASTSCVH
jgi:ferric-dicitrate binding protein FerR (iron transport regulator)